MLIQFITKGIKQFNCHLFVIISIVAIPVKSLASPSVILFEIGEAEKTSPQKLTESTIRSVDTLDFVLSNITLQDLLPSLSAITGASFKAAGPLNYKLDTFDFVGKTQDLSLKITNLLPVGFYGNAETYEFYSLETKTTKTYDPSRFDVTKLLQRFAVKTTYSNPKLGFNRLESGAVVFEGPKSLFVELEKDVGQPAQRPIASTSLIKGGLKIGD